MIYLFCQPYFPGVQAVFKNVESLGLGKRIGIYEFSPSANDLTILGAWDQQYSLLLRRLRCKKAILWTSSSMQMEMSPSGIEIEMFKHVLDLQSRKIIDRVFIVSRELYRYLEDKYPVEYFPAPLSLGEIKCGERIANSVGLFVPQGLRKNIYNQKLAVEMLQRSRPIIFYTNEAGWLPADKYQALLSSIWVNLQVVHPESWNYQVCDALASGTLSVISPSIAKHLEIGDRFTVQNLDSPTEIKDMMNQVLDLDEKSYKYMVERQYYLLKKKAEENNAIVSKILESS